MARAMKRRCVLMTSPRSSSVPVLITWTRIGATIPWKRRNRYREQLKARLRRVFVLLLANQRELFALDHRAIDRHLRDVFAARNVIHDIEHDPLEHRP